MSGFRSLVWLTSHEDRARDPFGDVGGLSPGPRPPRAPKPRPDCPRCVPWAACARHSYKLERSVAT